MSNDTFTKETEQSEWQIDGSLNPFLQDQVDNQISPPLPPSSTFCSSLSPFLNHCSATPAAGSASQSNNNQAPTAKAQAEFGCPASLAETRALAQRTQIIDAGDLNYSDRYELLRERDKLDDIRKHCLTLLEAKRHSYADGIPNAYFDSGYLVLGLATEGIAQRYVCCGRPGSQSRQQSIHCGKWLVCQTCAERKTKESLARYANIFHKGTFYFVTISFSGDLPFASHTSSRLLGYWEAINAAIKAMCKDGTWKGAYWVDELSIRHFLPLRVLPHAHAIIHADRMTPEDLDQVRDLVIEYTGDEDTPVQILLTPSIASQHLTKEADLTSVIGYLTKAMNLVKPYSTAWHEQVGDNRDVAFRLNKEAKELIEGSLEIFKTIKGKKRKCWAGSMVPNSKFYIGNAFTKNKPRSKKKRNKDRKA